MIRLKTPEEIEILREGGRRLAGIIKQVRAKVAPGVTTEELNSFAHELASNGGDSPAFLHYKPDGVRRPYPASICISINEEIVHGIPTEPSKTLKEGDVVTLDMGLKHKGLITDHAVTVGVGKVSDEARSLIAATEEALYKGIKAAQFGKTVGDIGAVVGQMAEDREYGNPRELAGHGVGYDVHEDPFVPNYGNPGEGAELKEGMVIAIEPMFTLGTSKIEFDADEYTVRTKDGSLAAHFEHTIVITKNGPEILTKA